MSVRVYVAHAITHRAGTPEEVAELIRWLKDRRMEVIHPMAGRGTDELARRTLEDIRGADVVVGDVSTCSHGVGFELGYAHAVCKPVIVIAREDRRKAVSKFLQAVFPEIIWYTDAKGLLEAAARIEQFETAVDSGR